MELYRAFGPRDELVGELRIRCIGTDLEAETTPGVSLHQLISNAPRPNDAAFDALISRMSKADKIIFGKVIAGATTNITDPDSSSFQPLARATLTPNLVAG
jgi:hypothetical protein